MTASYDLTPLTQVSFSFDSDLMLPLLVYWPWLQNTPVRFGAQIDLANYLEQSPVQALLNGGLYERHELEPTEAEPALITLTRAAFLEEAERAGYANHPDDYAQLFLDSNLQRRIHRFAELAQGTHSEDYLYWQLRALFRGPF